MRDPRTHEAAIVAVSAVAAVAGLGKASRTKSFARLAAWDKRRAQTNYASSSLASPAAE